MAASAILPAAILPAVSSAPAASRDLGAERGEEEGRRPDERWARQVKEFLFLTTLELVACSTPRARGGGGGGGGGGKCIQG